jgi:hypothetical protein
MEQINIAPKLEKILEEVPWGNIVHIYGRASDFPVQIKDILSNGSMENYTKISSNIEHQDSVSQATPFMLNVLLELLNYNVNKKEIIKICQKVWDAVQFFFEGGRGTLVSSTMYGMSDKQYLWIDYIDDDTDEMLWEEIIQDNFYDWNYYSLKLFYEYKEQIYLCTNSSDEELRNISSELFTAIENNNVKHS